MTFHFSLFRTCTNIDGTFGVIILDNYPLCLSLEPPWLNNEPRISCIPPGHYEMRPWRSPLLKINTWRIENVKNRDGILFHPGNDGGGSDSDTLGCILLGNSFQKVGGKDQKMGIASSKIAFQKFTETLKNTNLASLEIINCF